MAEIRAFRAHRYDLGRVGALGDVVAPPYDVIDPVLQQQLYDRSPYNVIRLILNKENPTDTDADNRYTRSAAQLRDWLQEGILKQDSASKAPSPRRKRDGLMVLYVFGREAVFRSDIVACVSWAKNLGHIRLAKPSDGFDQRVQDGL